MSVIVFPAVGSVFSDVAGPLSVLLTVSNGGGGPAVGMGGGGGAVSHALTLWDGQGLQSFI